MKRGTSALTRSHYHCPSCEKIFGRRNSMIDHRRLTKNCLGVIESEEVRDMDIDSKNKSSESLCEGTFNFQCIPCDKRFRHQSSLRRHAQLKHNATQLLPSVYVDTFNGIYMVAQSDSGPLAPIHVQKHTLKQKIMCTDDDCISIIKAISTVNPGIQCRHLDSISESSILTTNKLQLSSLNRLREFNILNDSSVQWCKNMKEISEKDCCTLVALVDFSTMGFETRTIYFSVYTEKIQYFAPLKRVRVSFNKDNGEFSCLCPTSGMSSTCYHEAVAKWCLLEQQPEWIKRPSSICHTLTDNMDYMMKYFLTKKRIPAEIPQRLLRDISPPLLLTPSEQKCLKCNEDLCIKNKKRTVAYGMGHIWKTTELFIKECAECGMEVRYQEYEEGFHNFDNSVLLSLKLCCYLLRGLKNHISIESNLKMLFIETIPYNKIRNAFLHFLALQDYQYDFCCLKCGIYPTVLICDGNWKNTCRRPVEAVDKTQNTCDLIDVDATWEKYQMEIIGRGFYGCKENPWKVEIMYNTVAPWISPECRFSSEVPNTEHRKGFILNKPVVEKPLAYSKVSHEDILQAINSPLTSDSRLIDLCEVLGISSKGSSEDLVNTLNELVLFKDVCPKMYKSIKHCGGGIVHFRCPHGICYYMKYLLRQESARDYIDGILSLKRQPHAIISDIASQVAHHGEARKRGIFGPDKGMLFAYTDKNLELEKHGSLPQVKLDAHKKYSLCDRFHTRSKKKTAENSFRNLKYCSDLNINTSVAEQENAHMAKDRSSVCSMDTTNFLWLSRVSINLRNKDINSRYEKKMKTQFGNKIRRNHEGIAIPDVKGNVLDGTSGSVTEEELLIDEDDEAMNEVVANPEDNVYSENIQSGMTTGTVSQYQEDQTFCSAKMKSTSCSDGNIYDSENKDSDESRKCLFLPAKFNDIQKLWKSTHRNRIECVVGDTKKGLDKECMCLLEGDSYLDDKVRK
uniref:uncharacterized protein LOC120344622 isoform X3 n=1 Tax=Styela clava TaxID=7725 RepID=UPI00193A45B1|nr:uncharacterized protein LOC120344622 isoform X3 [Styela clava]